MFQPPQHSGSYDTEAEVKRRVERARYPSVWVELWYLTLLALRLPFRLLAKLRRTRRR